MRTTKSKHKELSESVIANMEKCFVYALNQNKDNSKALAAAVQNITPHLLGDHRKCGQWCEFLKNPESYKHRGLPYGKDLQSPQLKTDLQAVTRVYSSNAAKFAPLASSQVESFHNIVASKAPKTRHYGSTESNDLRMAVGICRKNEGHQFVLKVLDECGLSPAGSTTRHSSRLQKAREQAAARKATPEFKGWLPEICMEEAARGPGN